MFLENTEKYETFFVPIEKEITKIDNLWQLHYQILLIMPQKEFTKLNVN